MPPIERVVVYIGHLRSPMIGPYFEHVRKNIQMFQTLNRHREARGKNRWEVIQSYGEELIEFLHDPQKTLLAVPAGQSTHFDRAFHPREIGFLQKEFFEAGGRGYFTCGSAYWVSRIRQYNDVCTQHPAEKKQIIKKSRLPLFSGIAAGPLCFHPSPSYKVGFFSEAVGIASGKKICTMLLSGGGSFLLDKGNLDTQVVAEYSKNELIRIGKSAEQFSTLSNAAVLVRIKEKGAAILSMTHPYYGASDLNPERYSQVFPESKTNWKEVVSRLSSEEARMNFVQEAFIDRLESG